MTTSYVIVDVLTDRYLYKEYWEIGSVFSHDPLNAMRFNSHEEAMEKLAEPDMQEHYEDIVLRIDTIYTI